MTFSRKVYMMGTQTQECSFSSKEGRPRLVDEAERQDTSAGLPPLFL
ncbi:MAG: hypothetical protein HYZ21_07330 [Chloroflexi bacterium]|nr:hypothetical protein [Chloroflexota bacterium]